MSGAPRISFPGNARSGLKFVAPPGSLASAPVASAGNKDMWYNSTDFGPCRCVSYMNNAGNDYINCGRPAWIADLHPSHPYRICGTFRVSDIAQIGVLSGLAGGAGFTQFNLRLFNSKIGITTGSLTAAEISMSGLANAFVKVETENDGTATKIRVNGGAWSTPVANGSETYTGNLYIGGRTDGVTGNIEGDIFNVCYTNLDGSLIDRYDMNKWDGSTSGKSDMGYQYSVTKVAPSPELFYAFVPVSRL